MGGCGGAGASLFAAALAQAATDALLVDLDPWGGGIDLLLGGETDPGLALAGPGVRGGRLNWSALRDALPRSPASAVLSGTRRGYEMDAGRGRRRLDAGRRGGVTVVCDLPRRLTDATAGGAGCAPTLSSSSARAMCGRARRPRRWPRCWPRSTPTSAWSCGARRRADCAQLKSRDITGLPLLAAMRPQPRLAEQLEHGGLRLAPTVPAAAAARRVLAVLPRGETAER